jgi:HAMP domain-containing protein
MDLASGEEVDPEELGRARSDEVGALSRYIAAMAEQAARQMAEVLRDEL